MAAGLKLALTSTTDNNDTTEGSTISYDNINPTEDPTTSDLTAGFNPMLTAGFNPMLTVGLTVIPTVTSDLTLLLRKGKSGKRKSQMLLPVMKWRKMKRKEKWRESLKWKKSMIQ
jgi:hypothetical protein